MMEGPEPPQPKRRIATSTGVVTAVLIVGLIVAGVIYLIVR